MPSLIEIHPMTAKLFHADGRTDGETNRQADMTKLIVAFRNFANEQKKKIFGKNMMNKVLKIPTK
jgi:hypothetical protein